MTIPVSTVGIAATSESSSSAVSWGPVIAGALVATAVTGLLALLGTGLGLTIVSPWGSEGASATTFAVSTAIWLIVMQWVSAGLGGYLTGRLRTKWSGVHNDEVYFRDTAHGFLTWALATLLVASVAGSVISSTASSGVQAVSSLASGATTAAATAASNTDMSTSYFTDTLLRPQNPGTATADNADVASEVSRIIASSAASGSITPEDKTYLSGLIAARTGVSQQEAQTRIDATLKRIEDAKVAAKQAADTARKAGATMALLGALSLLIGAFIASVAATYGGIQRDEDEVRYARA
jgi:hypothetical protein